MRLMPMPGSATVMRYSSLMGNELVGPYLETPEVLRLCDLPYSTLDSWVRTGLVEPSVRAGSGRRRPRLWSIADVVEVRALKALRDAGAPLRVLNKARQTLQDSWVATLRDRMLYWDGGDLILVDEWSNLMSLVKQPGQTVVKIVAMPLDVFHDEAHASAISPPSTSTLPSEPRRRA